MEENKVTLFIDINYGNEKKKIELDEIISYDELKDKIIELFNLDKNKKDNIELTYLDEDRDINVLGQEKNELIFAAKELMDGNYFIELNLSIIKIENNNNIIIEDDNRNNIINENDKINEKDKEINLIIDNNELLKKELKNKLNLIYKTKLEDLQNKINDLVNEKYNLIQKEIIQLSSNIDKNDFIKINTNAIDDNTKLEKIEIDTGGFILLHNNEEVIIYKDVGKKNKNEFQSNLNKIKDIIKQIRKEKNKTNLIFMKFGDEIYDIMKSGEDKIEITDLNEYLKQYLSRKGKEQYRADFINIMSKLYKYIEIKKINQINLDFFEKGPEIKKETNLLNNKEKKDFKSQLDALANTNKYKEEIIQNFHNYINIK